MITSMTSYAKAEERRDEFSADIEIRTYNSRHLDFNLRVPHGYSSIEEKIKLLVSSRLTRGRIELRLTVKDESEDAHEYEINIPKARAYCSALNSLAEMTGIENTASLEMVTAVSGMITPVTFDIDLDNRWPVIETCITKSLDNIIQMRQAEGDYLKKDFLKRLEFISTSLKKIEESSSDLIRIYKERLIERISKLTDGVVETDEARVMQEAAIIADKSDISEEIVRAKSHIKQFYDIMNSSEPGGRKLNFLLQEFNREFNTMGSKIGKAETAHIIVDVKAELEKMREQIQNVE